MSSNRRLKKIKAQIRFSSSEAEPQPAYPTARVSKEDLLPPARQIHKFPTKVSVLGTIYTVKYLVPRSMDGNLGSTDTDAKLIKIRKPTPDTIEIAQSTLLHEMIHAALHQSGLSQLLSEKNEEAIVRMLEDFMFPLTDTDKLMKQGVR